MFIAIKDITEGMKLAEDVYSKLGGIIYRKGTVIKSVDKEILEAFNIDKVNIEKVTIDKGSPDGNTAKEYSTSTVSQVSEKDSYFKSHFNQAIKVIDKIMKLAQGNAQIPIMELRKALQPLLKEELMQFKLISSLQYLSPDQSRYNNHHSLAVSLISYTIATWKGLEQGERTQIALAGALHEIGMSRVTSNFQDIVGPLSPYEYEEVKKHTLYGYQLLKGTKGLNEGTILAVLQHHERVDGSGYPLQLKGDNIHLFAKIVAIADVFHALTSKRSYRGENSVFQALEQIRSKEIGKLDPEIINLFISKMTSTSLGTEVLLNNGKEAKIVFFDQQNPTRPCVKVDDEIINLLTEKQLFIKDLL